MSFHPQMQFVSKIPDILFKTLIINCILKIQDPKTLPCSVKDTQSGQIRECPPLGQ